MPKCKKCLKVKKKSQFPKDGRCKDGFSPICKSCKETMNSRTKKPVKKDSKTDSTKPAKKKCSGCGKLKARTEFSKDRTKKDGLYHLCKMCRSNYRLKKKEVKKSLQDKDKGPKKGHAHKKDTRTSAGVNSEAAYGTCSVCGNGLIGYIPGYLQGQPVCKSCVISNLKGIMKGAG